MLSASFLLLFAPFFKILRQRRSLYKRQGVDKFFLICYNCVVNTTW